jgi:threonine dehydratase
VLIPPYNHPHVISGQGTMALELLEQVGMHVNCCRRRLLIWQAVACTF